MSNRTVALHGLPKPVRAVCALRRTASPPQHFQRSWLWDAYVRTYNHGPSTHHLFIPKPFRMALATAEQRFLDDQTITVLDCPTMLHLLQKVGRLLSSKRRSCVLWC